MILRIATIVFPIFAIVAVGYLYARRKKPEMAMLNQLNMDIFMPALIFFVLVRKEFESEEYLPLALAAILVVLGSGLLSYPIARRLGFDWRTFVPPMMFTNYGNLGLPLFVLAFGDTALSAAVVLFIAGNFLHFTLGRYFLDHTVRPLALLRTPILMASILGLLFNVLQWHLPKAIEFPIEMMGQVAIPLLLFSLGARLTKFDWHDWKIGLVGAIVCPVVGVFNRCDNGVSLTTTRPTNEATDTFRSAAARGTQFSVCRTIQSGTTQGCVYRDDRQSILRSSYPNNVGVSIKLRCDVWFPECFSAIP